METDIAMLLFFTIQVVFNISVIQKCDSLLKQIRLNENGLHCLNARLDLQRERLDAHSKEIFK